MSQYLTHVLIVDDDYKICSLLHKILTKNNLMAFYALNTNEARSLLSYFHFDIMLLDWMMPKESGLSFIKALRTQKYQIPIIMLTAISETMEKVQSLTEGADDYLTKPFNTDELLIRMRNLLTRTSSYNQQATLVRFGDLVFNKNNNILSLNDEEINLSQNELDILKIFIDNINTPLDKYTILEKLGKTASATNIDNINVNIMRLRRKIEPSQKPKYIRTLRGKGFILRG